MSRHRRYGEEHSYPEWHRNAIPELYRRRGHRLDMADRDWTEACHFCREPLAFLEEVMDRGQDLADKATTITRRTGERANVPALLLAPRIDRPPEVQAEIDRLQRRVIELQTEHPIDRFTGKRLWPSPAGFEVFTPDEWAAELYLMHRDHHQVCPKAQRGDPVYRAAAIKAARDRSRIWIPRQARLELEGAA